MTAERRPGQLPPLAGAEGRFLGVDGGLPAWLEVDGGGGGGGGIEVVCTLDPPPISDGTLYFRTDTLELLSFAYPDWVVAQSVNAGTEFPESPSPIEYLWRTDESKLYAFDWSFQWVEQLSVAVGTVPPESSAALVEGRVVFLADPAWSESFGCYMTVDGGAWRAMYAPRGVAIWVDAEDGDDANHGYDSSAPVKTGVAAQMRVPPLAGSFVSVYVKGAVSGRLFVDTQFRNDGAVYVSGVDGSLEYDESTDVPFTIVSDDGGGGYTINESGGIVGFLRGLGGSYTGFPAVIDGSRLFVAGGSASDGSVAKARDRLSDGLVVVTNAVSFAVEYCGVGSLVVHALNPNCEWYTYDAGIDGYISAFGGSVNGIYGGYCGEKATFTNAALTTDMNCYFVGDCICSRVGTDAPGSSTTQFGLCAFARNLILEYSRVGLGSGARFHGWGSPSFADAIHVLNFSEAFGGASCYWNVVNYSALHSEGVHGVWTP